MDFGGTGEVGEEGSSVRSCVRADAVKVTIVRVMRGSKSLCVRFGGSGNGIVSLC